MISEVYNKTPNGDEPFMLCAEDQSWDKATLKQLREEHDIIFMTGGNGVMPILVLNKESEHPIFVLGFEDDGVIKFKRRYGSFTNRFSPYWVKSLIADLREAVKFCNYIPFDERS